MNLIENGKDNYMKLVKVKDCWSFQTKIVNMFWDQGECEWPLDRCTCIYTNAKREMVKYRYMDE